VVAITRTGALESEGLLSSPPCLSLFPNESSVNENGYWLGNLQKNGALVFSEQLFTVFEEADEHHHGRTDKAEEKHRF
jgi:hypothetical protein